VTSRNQNCIVCGKCRESARYEVSEKSLERKPRYMRKGTVSPSKVPLILTDCYKTCTFVTQVWNSNEIRRKEAEIQAKRSLVFQVKYPYILIDCNQTFAVCSICMESKRYEVPGKSLQWEPRYCRKGIFFSERRVLNYWTISPKFASFVGRVESEMY